MDCLPGPLQLLSDYEELRMLMTHGLYVMPDSLDLYLWHGLINIREGRYKGGSFRFILCAHPLYPADGARPLVVFVDKPYHPLVDAESGALQVEARFTSWRGGVDRLPPVVELLREVLTSDLVLVPPSGRAYNQDAARLYRANVDEFDARARRSALAACAHALRRGPTLSPRGLAGRLFPPSSSPAHATATRSYLATPDAAGNGPVAGVEYQADGGERCMWLRSPYTPLLAQAPTAGANAHHHQHHTSGGGAAPPAAVPLITAAGALSPEGHRVATVAAAIGRARGFRLAEPSPLHEELLAELRSGTGASGGGFANDGGGGGGYAGGSQATDLLLRGVPAALEDMRTQQAAQVAARAAALMQQRERGATRGSQLVLPATASSPSAAASAPSAEVSVIDSSASAKCISSASAQAGRAATGDAVAVATSSSITAAAVPSGRLAGIETGIRNSSVAPAQSLLASTPYALRAPAPVGPSAPASVNVAVAVSSVKPTQAVPNPAGPAAEEDDAALIEV